MICKSNLILFMFLTPVLLQCQNAATVIEEQWTMPPMFGMPGSVRKVTTTLSNGWMRRDEMDSSQTILIRPDLGKLWLLKPKTGTYIEMNRETLRGLSMMAVMLFGIGVDAETGKPVVPDTLFRNTGRQMRIGPWQCSEVLAGVQRQAKNPVTMWISREPGLDSRQYALILKSLMGPSSSDYKAFFLQLNALDGYPVFIEAGSGSRRISQKLTGVRNVSAPESFFRVPKGYRKAESDEP
jgi:hypothetical protein